MAKKALPNGFKIEITPQDKKMRLALYTTDKDAFNSHLGTLLADADLGAMEKAWNELVDLSISGPKMVQDFLASPTE